MCICTTLAHQKILFTLIVLSFNDNNCNNNNMCSKSKYYIRMHKNTAKKIEMMSCVYWYVCIKSNLVVLAKSTHWILIWWRLLFFCPRTLFSLSLKNLLGGRRFFKYIFFTLIIMPKNNTGKCVREIGEKIFFGKSEEAGDQWSHIQPTKVFRLVFTSLSLCPLKN